jgi:hypothetical protein
MNSGYPERASFLQRDLMAQEFAEPYKSSKVSKAKFDDRVHSWQTCIGQAGSNWNQPSMLSSRLTLNSLRDSIRRPPTTVSSLPFSWTLVSG